MKRFDLISDLHIEFWLKPAGRFAREQQHDAEAFVRSLLPGDVSNTLVIAGDLGHYNELNYEVLQAFKRYYTNILVVAGNHDYYVLDAAAMQRAPQTASIDRWTQMKTLATALSGVHILEGRTISLDGIRFGGTGMWYDFEYSLQVLGLSWASVLEAWSTRMNDRTYLTGLPLRTLEMFREEKARLQRVIASSDVLVTHVSPDWSSVSAMFARDPLSGCFYFDGSDFFAATHGKLWCSGHVHQRHSYVRHGCRFINNSLGYPAENSRTPGKIVTLIC
ncbi:metallophosphoesterase family protein [Paenibacillus koleovorans]|uniref:metallophosphoesterase family protein n=1 Tax=Paenibacillus koleovorans TaxID=121608 RepID=UPI000FD9B119|nr:metallophosphoesterase [Paenibacillus koleovorans]